MVSSAKNRKKRKKKKQKDKDEVNIMVNEQFFFGQII